MDKRSNPEYIKLNGYNTAYDFNISKVGDVIPNDYSKKTRLRAFKKNFEEAEQVKRVQGNSSTYSYISYTNTHTKTNINNNSKN